MTQVQSRQESWDGAASDNALAVRMAAQHRHGVQFYGDQAFLVDGSSRFVAEALAAGDAAVIFATGSFRNALAERVQERGVDVDLATRQGRYTAVDASSALGRLMVDGVPDPRRFDEIVGHALRQARQAARGRRGHVAVFGEMVALLWADGQSEAALQVERLWNSLAATVPFTLQCAYPISTFCRAGDEDAIARICAEHTDVVPAETFTALTSDQERLQAIAMLQQKAIALETEIAARQRVEQVLREKNEALQAAVATRDAFLSVAAHELKTPLTGLRSFAQLLQRNLRRQQEIDPARLETALDAIELQTGKLSHLVGRLLDSAQIDAGKLRVEPQAIDLAALVQSAIAPHQAEGHPILYDGPAELAATVDPVRFEQVVANLLDNALKYSPQGGAVIVRLAEEPAGSIRLTITDHGIGIPADQRERVFDRFQQAHQRWHLSGLGLGLFITREIIDLHGGQVRLEQPEHPGTRAIVTLPMTISRSRS